MKWFYYLLSLVLIVGIIWLAWPNHTAVDTTIAQSIPLLRAEPAKHSDKQQSANTPTTAWHSLWSSSDEPAAAAEPETAADVMPLQERLQAMSRRRAGQTYDQDAVAAAVTQNTAWRALTTVPESLPLTPVERNDGRQFIELDPLKLESLMPGDEITISVTENGAEYRGRIDSVEIHDSGSISWFGHLVGLDNHYTMTFTRGTSLTVGGMDTPEGHYVLQSHGELGWIASSETLFKRNPDETDAIVPPTGPG
jgi:hypothetical protein